MEPRKPLSDQPCSMAPLDSMEKEIRETVSAAKINVRADFVAGYGNTNGGWSVEQLA